MLAELEAFVREYCRIDSDEQIQFDVYLMTAIEYLTNAGVSPSKQDRPLYKLAVALLVGHWIENRQVTTSENNTALKYSLNYMIAQLKYCEEEDNS